MHKHSRQ